MVDLLLYVDDMLIIKNYFSLMDTFLQQLNSKLAMKDLG